MSTYIDQHERFFDKIGGWLVLPAFLHPIIGCLVNLKGSYDVFESYSEKLTSDAQVFLLVCGILGLAYAAAWIYSAFLAGSLNPVFPKFYIWMNIFGVTMGIVILAVVAQYFGVKTTSADIADITRNGIAAAIWIPYMLVSRRVKATFYGVPMPDKRTPKNVSEPLRQFVQDHKAAQVEPQIQLTMIQRLGMVLYWAGLLIAILLSIGGVIALVNAKSDAGFIGAMLLGSAAICWIIGRALKYILVGR